jgi:hypothetical protein
MSKSHNDLKELERVAKSIKSVELRQPLQKFTKQKFHPLKLRAITAIQEQFDKQLETILLEPEPKEAFYKLCDLYARVLPQQRSEIRKQWNFNRAWEIPDQTTLACNLPKDRSCEERIRASLIYASLMNHDDYRDVLIWLALIYHSALKSGINAVVLFKEIADISSPIAASLIHSFINRDPNEKSLSAWCLAEEPSVRAVRFIPC